MEKTLPEVAAELSEGYRQMGYHCSESSLRAVAEVLDIDIPEVMLKLSSGFRGGGGGYRDRCGIVETGIMMISFLYGRAHCNECVDRYSYLVRVLHDRFLDELGSYNCRILNIYSKKITPDQSCSYIYEKGTAILTQLLMDAENLLAQMPKEEIGK